MLVCDFVRDIKWRCVINCVCFRSYPTEYKLAGNSWGEPRCRRERGREARQLRPASGNIARGPPRDTIWRRNQRRRTSGPQALLVWCPFPTASSCLCWTVASYRLVSFLNYLIKLPKRFTVFQNCHKKYCSKLNVLYFRTYSLFEYKNFLSVVEFQYK